MKNFNLNQMKQALLALSLVTMVAACGSKNDNPPPAPAAPAVAPVPPPCPPIGCLPTNVAPLVMAAGGSGAQTMVLGLQFMAQGTNTTNSTLNYVGPFTAIGEFFLNQPYTCISPTTGASVQIPAGRYNVNMTQQGMWAAGTIQSTFQVQATGPASLLIDVSSGAVQAANGSFTSPSGAVFNYYLTTYISIDGFNGQPCAPIPYLIGP